MHNIYLILTKHRESGLCNSDELLKIFEKIKPDVIFEEISPSRFNAYYKDHSVSTLETNSIKKYLEIQKIKNIPVDKDIDMSEVIKEYKYFRYLNDFFFNNSIDYCKLWERNVQMTDQYGFKYLNSTTYTEASNNIRNMEKTLIKCCNSKELVHRYTIWVNSLLERDVTMLDNIYNYCKKNYFERGIFTIGAEHKISILELIQQNKDNQIKINWIYDEYNIDIAQTNGT